MVSMDLPLQLATTFLDEGLQGGGAGIELANPFIASVVSFTVAMVPIYLGISLPRLSGRWEGGRRALFYGAGIGILSASFFDLLKETRGISTGTLNSVTDLFNVLALVLGLAAFLAVHSLAKRSQDGLSSLPILYLWALLGVGFHSVGEGVIIGYDLVTGATVLSLPQLSSFALHKLAEGLTVGVLLVEGGYRLKHGGLSGLLAGFPIVLGTVAGISGLPAVLSTYFFATGAGATIYVLTRFATNLGSASSSKVVIGIMLGFLYMYLSGVLHQFQ